MTDKTETEKKGLETSDAELKAMGLLGLKQRSKLFSLVFTNAPIKLISLLCALTLFFYVQYSSSHTRSVEIQVIPPELPSKLVFSQKIPSFLNIKFYGKEEQMDFDISRFQVRLENPNPQSGSNLYIAHLEPEPPSGVRVIYKKELQLFIDHILSRELV